MLTAKTKGIYSKILVILVLILISTCIIGRVYGNEEEKEIEVGQINAEESMEESTEGEMNNLVEDSVKLLPANVEDKEYEGVVINLSDNERKLVESVVMGETSGLTFEAAAVVAQAIRDAMVTDGLTVEQVLITFQYTKNHKEPNDNVRNAVRYIFDDGKYIVKHRVLYFYAPSVTRSGWHETQQFVIEHGGHRVFDRVQR